MIVVCLCYYSGLRPDAGLKTGFPRAVDVRARGHACSRCEGSLQGPAGLVLRRAAVEVRAHHTLQDIRQERGDHTYVS